MNKIGKSWVQAYKEVEEKSNKSFDTFCQSELSRKGFGEQYGIPVPNEDYRFLESIRTDRKASCEGKGDTKYHIAEAVKKKSNFLSFFSMNTEHLQLSEPESFTKINSGIRNRGRWH